MNYGILQSRRLREYLRLLKNSLLALACLLSILLPITETPVAADDLGEHILKAVLSNQTPSDGALLLLTRDLKWYEQNMGRLPQSIQARVQQLRINAAGDASRMAARKLNEAESLFAATGSWKPGRDMDIIYFGRNGDSAANAISTSYETVTGRILDNVQNDPILRSYAGPLPRALPAECLAVCTTELPNYGYRDLQKAYQKAKEALARGESREDILNALRTEIRQAMESNIKAHFAAAANPDYYAGATGQEWFRKTYLNDKEKMRVFGQNEDGEWALKSGGIDAVPGEIVERIGFGSIEGAREVKFAKIASDYALFYSHMHGGPSDNAKYAIRVWKDMGLSAIQDLSENDLRILAAAKAVSNNPAHAQQILAELGVGSVEDFNAGVSRILHRWTESQMLRNMERIVADLSASSAKTADEFEKLFKQAKSGQDLNEIVAGLNKLGGVPNGKVLQTQLLESLQAKFGNTDSGKAAIRFILHNLGILGDTGEITARILRMLARAGRISAEEAEAAIASGRLSGSLQSQVNRVKKEIIALNAGAMVEFDSAIDLDTLMNDWRQAQPGAVLQTADDDLRKIISEMADAPDMRLRDMGWTAEEIAIQNRIRSQLRANKQMMPSLGERLKNKLAKVGISLRDVQADVRKLMFNPAYTKFGDASISIGAFDGIVGAGAAMFQTYMILNGPAMSEAEETIALGNAWVTAIPVVGDFAQGIITGSEGYWEGDKKKLAEAGLWVSIGITGMIPGGQIPAIVGSLMLAMKPAAEGVYEASQAQNLVQAWIESGKWGTGQKPQLEGVYDRDGLLHRLNYDEILGSKGEAKYDSTRLKSIVFREVTIAESVRDYANKYVLAGNKNIDVLRENLKTLFPDLSDSVLNDLSFAQNKIAEKKSRLADMFFKAYERQVRGAYVQTIAHLKKWAEDERRAAKDYDGEVKRLRAELAAIEKELKNASLLKHADDTVNSYAKMATNLFEQETLPLSKVRIYENYIATYREIRSKLQAVSQLFTEASSKYVPSSWFLTGFPVFDRDITSRLVALMTAERGRASDQVVQLLKDLNQKDTHLNLQNDCHKKAFDSIAANRYKIAFTQHLAEYYRALSGESSKWSDTFTAARSSYETVRDGLLKSAGPVDVRVHAAFVDAFTQFFFSMAYIVAANDTDAYRQVADGYEAQLVALREHDKSDRMAGTESEAGKVLQQCLNIGLQFEIQVSTTEPEVGSDIDAVVKLTKGILPKETSWAWVPTGGLTAKQRFGETTVVSVQSEGELVVRLMDERYTNKSIAETKVKIVPKSGSFRVQLSGPSEGEVGKALTFGAEPTAGSMVPKDVQYVWTVDEQSVGQGQQLSRSFSEARTVGVRVDAYRIVAGKRVLLDSARQTVAIRDLPKKDESEDKKKEQEQSEKEKAAREQAERERMDAEQRERERMERERVAAEQAQKVREEQREAASAVSSGSTASSSSTSSASSVAPQKASVPCVCDCSGVPSGFQADKYSSDKKTLWVRASVSNVSDYKSEDSPGYRYNGTSFSAKTSGKGTVQIRGTIYGIKDISGNPYRVSAVVKNTTTGKVLYQMDDTIPPSGGSKQFSYAWDPAQNPGSISIFASTYGSWVETPPFTYFVKGTVDGPPAGAAICPPQECSGKCTGGAIDPGKTEAEKKEEKKDEQKTKLAVALQTGKTKLSIGETTQIKATVSGGKPSYQYAWSGEQTGSGDSVSFTAKKSGSSTISVNVKDSAGSLATASVVVDVAPVSVTIEKTSPGGMTVPVGGQATFRATVKGATDVNYLWQPHPQVAFKPFEKSATTTATFTDPGSVGVWVEVFMKDGAVMRTVGRSNEITIQVDNPQWAIEFSPGNPRVGQPVKAKIASAGAGAGINTGEMNFRWQLPANAKQTGTSKDDSEITFVLNDTKQANIACTVATKRKNENLGGAGKTIAAQGFGVKVSGPRGRQDVEIWKCETQLGGAPSCGMKKVPNQYAAGTEILFGASVEPLPEKPVSYSWTSSPAGCTIPSPFSRDIGMTCSSTGNYTVTLTAKSYGAVIGSASASVNVSISQDEIGKSRKARDAYEKLQKAKGLVAQGSLDEGIALANEVKGLDPKNAEATTLAGKWSGERQTVKDQISRLAAYLQQNKVAEAEKELSGAQRLHPKYPPVVDAEKKLKLAKESQGKHNKEIEEKLKLAKDQVAQGKLDEGIAVLDGILKTDPKHAESQSLSARWKAEKEKVMSYLGTVQTLTSQNRSADAEKALQEARKLHPKYPPVLEAEKKLAAFRSKDAQVQKLLAEGYEFEKQKRYQDAVKKYQEAYALVPNAEIQKRIGGLQERIGKEQKIKQLVDEGYALEQKKNYQGAIDRYRQANAIEFNQKIEDRIRGLEKQRTGQAELEKKGQQVQQLVNDGYKLEEQKNYAGALEKYRQANAIEQNPKIAERIKVLEASMKQQQQASANAAQAKNLRGEGEMLQNQKQYAAAAAKYRESLKYQPDPALEQHIAKLEAAAKQQQQASANATQAKNLRGEGEMLQNQKQYAAAAAKYRESLKYQPDPALEQHIAKLEAAAKQQQQASANATQAKNLRAEGERLQNQKQYAAAAAKYRESLKYQPDPALEQHIAKLETAAKQQQQSAGSSGGIELVAAMTNQGKDNVHIVVAGQEDFGPQNRIAPGASVRKTIRLPQAGSVKFSAGRGGRQVAWCSVNVAQRGEATVTFRDPDRLTCVSGGSVPSAGPMNMSGTWRVNCGERESYTVRVSQNGNSFQAFVEDDKYTGTINGNTYTGQWRDSKAGVTVDIRGTIVSASEMRQTHTVSTSSGQPIKASCVLRRM